MHVCVCVYLGLEVRGICCTRGWLVNCCGLQVKNWVE